MKKRIISAIFMLPLLVFLYFRGIPLLVFMMLLSVMAMREFYRGFETLDIHAPKWLGYLFTVILYLIVIWGEFDTGNEQKVYAHLLCLWIFILVSVGLFVGLFKKGMPVLDGIVMATGNLYIAFFFVHVSLITRIYYYDKLVWLVFIAALGSDICAYFTGVALGKHKLCPAISPNKTVEGSIGGIAGAGILCVIFGLIAYKSIWVHCLIIGIFGAVFSQLGDLTASMFKRKMGIKDFGNLIPGHGGVLDRFDSVLLTAPFVYYYILVVIRP